MGAVNGDIKLSNFFLAGSTDLNLPDRQILLAAGTLPGTGSLRKPTPTDRHQWSHHAGSVGVARCRDGEQRSGRQTPRQDRRHSRETSCRCQGDTARREDHLRQLRTASADIQADGLSAETSSTLAPRVRLASDAIRQPQHSTFCGVRAATSCLASLPRSQICEHPRHTIQGHRFRPDATHAAKKLSGVTKKSQTQKQGFKKPCHARCGRCWLRLRSALRCARGYEATQSVAGGVDTKIDSNTSSVVSIDRGENFPGNSARAEYPSGRALARPILQKRP